MVDKGVVVIQELNGERDFIEDERLTGFVDAHPSLAIDCHVVNRLGGEVA